MEMSERRREEIKISGAVGGRKSEERNRMFVAFMYGLVTDGVSRSAFQAKTVQFGLYKSMKWPRKRKNAYHGLHL